MRSHGGSDRLYNTLGVTRAASTEEIQRAYRRLALRYHPDRAGREPDASEARFKEIQEAFDVLKDERKRRMYDQFGEEALRWTSGGADLSPLLDPCMVCVWSVVMVVILALIIIQLALIVAQTMGDKGWKWGVLLIPTWILDVFVLAAVVFLLSLARNIWKAERKKFQRQNDDAGPDDEGKTPPLAPVLFVAGFLFLFFLQTVGAGAKLDGRMEGTSWGVVMLPLFMLDLMLMAQSVSMCRRRSYEELKLAHSQLHEAHNLPWYFPSYRWHCLIKLVLFPWRFLFLVLLAAKLGGSDIGWHGVGSPLYLLLIIDFGVNSVLAYKTEQEATARQEAVQGSVCGRVTTMSCIYGAAAAVVAIGMECAESGSPSLAFAFIPLWIALAVLCVLACLFPVVTAHVQRRPPPGHSPGDPEGPRSGPLVTDASEPTPGAPGPPPDLAPPPPPQDRVPVTANLECCD
eukprot:Hpha_TRINITY_DN310_c0_g1::TRINITY_DN310_c0_g1_i1::g.112641::m.112641